MIPFTAEWWNGPFFFPAASTLTFSDHRVGLGVITTPLIWTGASALTAYNIAFLSTFILSAISAYLLCLTLTRNRAAAFAGGLVFGFHPFRAEHLAHLELLASYWIPIVLLFAHRWVQVQRRSSLVWLAAALTLQGLTCGYYFFFSGVLLLLWLIWFLPAALPIGQYIRLGLALTAPLIALSPVFYTYRQAHAAMALSSVSVVGNTLLLRRWRPTVSRTVPSFITIFTPAPTIDDCNRGYIEADGNKINLPDRAGNFLTRYTIPFNVTGLPASLDVAEVASGQAAYPLPHDHPGGVVSAETAAVWEDANGNPYGPVAASASTTVASAGQLVATQTATLAVDADGSGLPSPGDTVRYAATITNHGGTAVTSVEFTATPDPHTALDAGSVTTTAGSVSGGNEKL